MLASEVLQKARDLISDPNAWTKGDLARDESGNKVDLRSDEATCFCSSGAIFRTSEKFWIEPIRFLKIVIGGSMRIGSWNDAPERTHTEVLYAFDRAIGLAKSKGK